MNQSALIESVLFAAGEPVALNELAKSVGIPKRELKKQLDTMLDEYQDRGLRLVIDDRNVQLVTAPEAADTLGRFLQEELHGKLSRSALEVLAIVAYRGPVTRPDIERIRGVQSAQPLRTLAIRGLITDVGRKDEPGRPILYDPTLELYKHLGISRREELPEVSEDLKQKTEEPAPAEV
ncbi:SMC-Scp complex subunit ScpB [Patescibacteria group bacterium]|nr:SMC-Scp complex subunit ScpB [Patescibacteria group bacterium]